MPAPVLLKVLTLSVPAVEMTPLPTSLIAPVDVRLSDAPPVVLTVPLIVTAPVLVTVAVPPPDCASVAIVSGALFAKVTFPVLVFVAFNPPTAFAPLRIRPPTEDVTSVPVVLTVPAPDSVIVPDEVSAMFPPPAFWAPAMLIGVMSFKANPPDVNDARIGMEFALASKTVPLVLPVRLPVLRVVDPLWVTA